MKIPSQNRLISFAENTKVTHLGTKWTGAEFEEREEGLRAVRAVQGEVAGGTGRMCRGRGEGGRRLGRRWRRLAGTGRDVTKQGVARRTGFGSGEMGRREELYTRFHSPPQCWFLELMDQLLGFADFCFLCETLALRLQLPRFQPPQISACAWATLW